MKVIGVLSQKGGAGKTTLTLHWAVAAQERTPPIAVIDIDPQASAIAWRKRRLAVMPEVLRATDANLRTALDACRAEGMRYVLIDTMPRVERPAVETARLADLVVIPCGPSSLDIDAIGATVAIVERTGTPAVIVINQGRPGSAINQQAAEVLAAYQLPICPIHVMRRAALADAFADGRAVMESEPNGKAASEIVMSWRWIEEQVSKKG